VLVVCLERVDVCIGVVMLISILSLRRVTALVAALAVTISGSTSVLAQTTSFTYQGKLTDAGTAANGIFDFEFRLFDATAGGAQIGSTVSRNDVPVTDGIFSVVLDFGAAIEGGVGRQGPRTDVM
jgi:hypothetical protein